MQEELKSYLIQIPSHFSSNSKVWIYQSNRLFSISEMFEIDEILQDFVGNWKSHGAVVNGFAKVFFGRFIVFMADESHTQVSGCSTDSSVHIVKKIEDLCKVDLFNRQLLAFVIKDKIDVLPMAQLQYAFNNQFIHEDTLYFNNLVSTKQELEDNWIVPIKDSWLYKRIHFLTKN